MPLGGGPVPKTITFIRDGTSLLAKVNGETRGQSAEPPMQARTLKLGERRLLLLSIPTAPGGVAIGYDISDGLLRQYWINPEAVATFFNSRPPSPSIALERSMGTALIVCSWRRALPPRAAMSRPGRNASRFGRSKAIALTMRGSPTLPNRR